MKGPEMGYVDLLDQEMTRRLTEEAAAPKKFSPLRPSGAGACTRSLAYGLSEFHGKENYHCQPFSPSTRRLLNLGSAIEAQVIEQLEECGFKALNQQQLLTFGRLEAKDDPTLNQTLQGSIDFLLFHEAYKSVVDVKSVGGSKHIWNAKSKAYEKYQSLQKLSPQAFWIEDLEAFRVESKDPFLFSNLAQLNFYASHEWVKSLGVDHAVILQYSKSDSQLREFRFKPSESLFYQTLEKFQLALDAVAQGIPSRARRDHEKDSVPCRYCRYEHVCKTVSEESSSELLLGA